jgi:hypothetical protein
MSRENAREKALRYLAEGRVRVIECHEDEGLLVADVRGTGASYAVVHDSEGWSCDCEARTECAHIIALKQVTVLRPRETRP